MEKQKKPWVKPEMELIPAGSPRFNEIMAALETEKAQPEHGGD